MSCCTIVLACLFSVYPFPVLPKELHYFFNILPEDSCIRLLHYAQFCVFTLIYLMPSSVVISTNLLRFKDNSRIENSNIFWCIGPIYEILSYERLNIFSTRCCILIKEQRSDLFDGWIQFRAPYQKKSYEIVHALFRTNWNTYSSFANKNNFFLLQ